MEKLRKALEERRLEKLRKAKYTKRTGSPGHYKYEYGPERAAARQKERTKIS